MPDEIPRQNEFKEQCAEHFPVDGITFISVVFGKDGSAFATRTMNLSPNNPHMEIDFSADGKRYELKHTPAKGAEIFEDSVDKEGNRLLSKIDPATDEYKKAYDTAIDIKFDTLPQCSFS